MRYEVQSRAMVWDDGTRAGTAYQNTSAVYLESRTIYVVVNIEAASIVCYCPERDYAEIIATALNTEPATRVSFQQSTDNSVHVTQRAICDNCLGTGERLNGSYTKRAQCIKCAGTGRI